MTLDEIRQNPEARASIAATLKDEWMVQALFAIEQAIPTKIPFGAEAIVSVRGKAYEDGQRHVLETLQTLILAPEEPAPKPVATWNSGLTEAQAQEAEKHI